MYFAITFLYYSGSLCTLNTPQEMGINRVMYIVSAYELIVSLVFMSFFAFIHNSYYDVQKLKLLYMSPLPYKQIYL